MKQLIYLLMLLALVGCVDKDNYNNQDGNRPASLTSSELLVHSVFPRTPMVAKGGSITLSAVVTNGAGVVLTSTINDPVYIEWSSSDPSVATVDERGAVFAKNLGASVITAVAKRGNLQSASYQITINVVNINSVDVAELFFSPPQAFIDLNGVRTFRLSAVDHSGAASALSEGEISFEVSNSNIEITPETITLSAGNNAVEVQALGKSKGFVFLTPVYKISKDSGQTVRITGTPLAIQVKDSVETNMPTSSIDAGRYLSLGIKEDGTGFKGAKVMHYDATQKELLFSDFYGSWTHTLSAAVTGAGKSAKMALSPFDSNLDQPMAVMMQNNKSAIWYQTKSGLWDKTTLSNADIVDENSSYSDDNRLMDIATFRGDGNASNAVHVAYYDAAASQVCIASLSSPTTLVSGTHTCIATSSKVRSVSIATNRTTGEPRLAYIVEERSIINENNTTTHVPATVYYVTRQTGGIYREIVATQNDKVSADVKHAVLKLDRNNKPIIALVDNDKHVRLFYREIAGASTSWQILPVTAVDPFPDSIASLDFALDSHNEPRLVYSTIGGGEQKVRYAKRAPFLDKSYRWTIETPALMREGSQGRSTAIAVDSQNRAHIVYSLENEKWFNYWAEPNFFNYQNFPISSYSGADLISSSGRLP